jgi:epsin
MGAPSFHEFKKQASFFLKEKIKTARLALTDVTPAELLTEETTNGNPWSPDAKTLRTISRAAFEVDDYFRIVGILHKRFLKFERKNWRVCYNSLILLDHLLTHGPESVGEDFKSDKDVIAEMRSFQYIDEKGFNWGLAVRKKSDRILKLLENGNFLKEERDRSRKLTRGIQGFGSFSQRSSVQGVLEESSHGMFERCNSNFNEHDENQNKGGPIVEKPKIVYEDANHQPSIKIEDLNSVDGKKLEKRKPQTSSKENKAPEKEELRRWDCIEEDNNPLLDGKRDELNIEAEDDHPFNGADNSLLSAREGILQGC